MIITLLKALHSLSVSTKTCYGKQLTSSCCNKQTIKMRFSLILMTMAFMLTPPCWRCWIGGVGARDTQSVMNNNEDTSSLIIKRGAGVSVCLDRYKSEPFLRYARCIRSIGSLNVSSDATRVNNSILFCWLCLSVSPDHDTCGCDVNKVKIMLMICYSVNKCSTLYSFVRFSVFNFQGSDSHSPDQC